VTSGNQLVAHYT